MDTSQCVAMALSKGKSGGSFRERKEDPLEINIRDLSSPWNFYSLFLQDTDTVLQWMR